MTGKRKVGDEEMRMSAREFDDIMRKALQVKAPSRKPAKPKVRKKKAAG